MRLVTILLLCASPAAQAVGTWGGADPPWMDGGSIPFGIIVIGGVILWIASRFK
jgi:hypothetical protein